MHFRIYSLRGLKFCCKNYDLHPCNCSAAKTMSGKSTSWTLLQELARALMALSFPPLLYRYKEKERKRRSRLRAKESQMDDRKRMARNV